MRVPANIEVGVATHTGRVRTANEDDFLVYAPQTPAEATARGWLIAIADGMGGVTGGAEASRTAVRAAARVHLDSANGDPEQRLRAGFRSAVERVYEFSRENPNLREMGTTLTILNLVGGRAILGHVGDTRCLLVRDGELRQLSVDHAVREPESFLTRCVGAGQTEVEVDVAEHELHADDRLLLMTDGLWGVVEENLILATVLAVPPQEAAEHLIGLANRSGGPDNSAVLVLHVHSTEITDRVAEVDLPAEEIRESAGLRAPDQGLVAPKWPIAVLICAVLFLVLGLSKILFDVDLWSVLSGSW
jgi:protein phosphatase